jgi:hypothetical protein
MARAQSRSCSGLDLPASQAAVEHVGHVV